MRVLAEAGRPLTVGELHQMALIHYPEVGLRTVYRNIRELVSEGKLVGVDYPGQPLRYEAVSPNGHHPHFICRSCNRVFQLAVEIPEISVKPPPGFTIEGEEVVFYGRCPECNLAKTAKVRKRLLAEPS